MSGEEATGQDFCRAELGRGGPRVFRLGLSASYFPGRKTVHRAFDRGVNVFFGYGWDFQMMRALRDLGRGHRGEIVVATGAYNLIWGHTSVRKTLERRLRQLQTDYIDLFLFLGVMKPAQLPERVVSELVRLREEGKARRVGISCHDRRFAGRLASEGVLDSFMIRYNAAHRGAEDDIFPHLAQHDPALVSYTATRWTALLRAPKGYPRGRRLPTAPECYRFVLGNPAVDVCLTAPRNRRELDENLAAVARGPLDEDDLAFMRAFGDRVHAARKWFM